MREVWEGEGVKPYFFFSLVFVVFSVLLCGISLFKKDEEGGICARYALWFLIFAVVNIAFKVFVG